MDDYAFLSDPHFAYTTAICFGCVLGFICSMLLVVADCLLDAFSDRKKKKKEELNK